MATKYWKGTATAVAQVSSATVTAYDAATTYKITVGAGNNTVVISAPGTTDANGTAAALRTAWNASTHPYCAGITAAGTGAAAVAAAPVGTADPSACSHAWVLSAGTEAPPATASVSECEPAGSATSSRGCDTRSIGIALRSSQAGR